MIKRFLFNVKRKINKNYSTDYYLDLLVLKQKITDTGALPWSVFETRVKGLSSKYKISPRFIMEDLSCIR